PPEREAKSLAAVSLCETTAAARRSSGSDVIIETLTSSALDRVPEVTSRLEQGAKTAHLVVRLPPRPLTSLAEASASSLLPIMASFAASSPRRMSLASSSRNAVTSVHLGCVGDRSFHPAQLTTKPAAISVETTAHANRGLLDCPLLIQETVASADGGNNSEMSTVPASTDRTSSNKPSERNSGWSHTSSVARPAPTPPRIPCPFSRRS